MRLTYTGVYIFWLGLGSTLCSPTFLALFIWLGLGFDSFSY